MEDSPPVEIVPTLADRVRDLGYDPAQLTPLEQQELVEFEMLCTEETGVV